MGRRERTEALCVLSMPLQFQWWRTEFLQALLSSQCPPPALPLLPQPPPSHPHPPPPPFLWQDKYAAALEAAPEGEGMARQRPRAVYLGNRAACLLKLEQFAAAVQVSRWAGECAACVRVF